MYSLLLFVTQVLEELDRGRAAPDGPQNQIESKPAIEVVEVESQAASG